MPSVGVGTDSLLFSRPLGAPYTTGAVVFDGATELVNAAISGPATITVYTSSEWYFLPANPATVEQWGIWGSKVDDPNALFGSYIYKFGDGHIYIEGDITSDDGGSGCYRWKTDPTAGVWHHILRCLDISSDPPSGAGYFDGEEMDPTDAFGAGGSVTFNGTLFKVGNFSADSNQFWPGYLADIWIAPGQDIREVDGTISPETRAKFRNLAGKPVDLGADGSRPTGVAPTVFLRRAPGADPSTFAHNRGTGGDFAVTGTLTDAATSPTD